MRQTNQKLMARIAALLLAAGRSKRMGAFKPLLPFGDKSVIRSCIDNLRTGGVGHITVVVGHQADKVKRHLRDCDVHFAVNNEPNSEMGASVACGIKSLPQDIDALVIALVDHPAVDSETVRLIIEQWRSGYRLVIPEFNGRGGHPVLVDMIFRDELLSLDPQLGLNWFFREHKALVNRVAVKSDFIARDIDTWDDYVSLHQELFGVPPLVNVPGHSEGEPERD